MDHRTNSLWQPHVTVATIVEHNGKYLLVEERAEGKMVLNQPAGHLDENESLQQAAVRETLEETAWTVVLKGVVGIALSYSSRSHITYHRTTFFAEALSHDPERALDQGIARALWLSYDDMLEAAQQMRSPLVISSVEQYRAGHRYPLELVF